MRSVLIVEDTDDIAEIIKSILEDDLGNQTYQAHIAYSSKDALDWLENNPPPDIILLDFMLPDLNADQLISTMRERNLATKSSIILMTAKRITTDDLKVFPVAIAKPFTSDELFDKMNQALNK